MKMTVTIRRVYNREEARRAQRRSWREKKFIIISQKSVRDYYVNTKVRGYYIARLAVSGIK